MVEKITQTIDSETGKPEGTAEDIERKQTREPGDSSIELEAKSDVPDPSTPSPADNPVEPSDEGKTLEDARVADGSQAEAEKEVAQESVERSPAIDDSDPFAPSEALDTASRQAELANTDEFRILQLEREMGMDDETLEEQELAEIEAEEPEGAFQEATNKALEQLAPAPVAQAPKEQAAPAPKEGEIDTARKIKEVEKEKGIVEEFKALGNLKDPEAFNAGLHKLLDKHIPSQEEAAAIVGGAIVQGTINNFQELVNLGPDIINGAAQLAGKLGIGDGTNLVDEKVLLKNLDTVIPTIHPSQAALKPVAGFVLSYGAATKGIKGLQTGGRVVRALKGTGVGALIQFAMADPEETNLAALFQKVPALANPTTAYLGDKTNNSRFEKRLKNAISDMLGGVIADAGIGALGIGGKIIGAGIDLGGEAVSALYMKAMRHYKVKRVVQDSIDAAAKGKTATQELAESGVDVAKVAKQHDEYIKKAKAENIVVKRTKSGKLKDIDINNIKSSKDLDLIAEGPLKKFKDQFSKFKKGELSIKEVKELSQELDIKPEDLLTKEFDESFDEMAVFASRNKVAAELRAQYYADVQRFDLMDSPTEAQLKELLDKQDVVIEATAYVQAEVSKAGRKLGMAHRLDPLSGSDAAKASVIEDSMKKYGGKADRLTMLNIIRQDKEKAFKGASELHAKVGGSFGDLMVYVKRNNLLSSPQTIYNATVGSGSMLGVNILERAGTRILTKGRQTVGEIIKEQTGKEIKSLLEPGIVEGEAGAMVKQVYSGFNDLYVSAREFSKEGGKINKVKGFLTGELADTTGTKVGKNSTETISAKAFGLEDKAAKVLPEGAAANVARAYDVALNMYGKNGEVLGSMDGFIGGMATRGELESRILRELNTAKAYEKWTPEMKGEAMKKFMDEPEKYVPHIFDVARREADVVKMVSNLQGFAGKLEDLANHNTGTQMMFQFLRTTFNEMKVGVQRTPVIGQLTFWNKFSANMKAGGAARDSELFKLGFYSMAGGSFMGLGYHGIMTGRGPTTTEGRRRMKEAKADPMTFDFGAVKVKYDKIPVLNRIGPLFADLGHMMRDLQHHEREFEASSLVTGTIGFLMNNFRPEFMSDTLGQLNKISDQGEFNEKIATRFMSEQFLSATPVLGRADVRLARKLTDPKIRDTSVDEKRKEQRDNMFADLDIVEQYKNELLNSLPMWSKTLPGMPDIYGVDREFVSGVSIADLGEGSESVLQGDSVALEMARLSLHSHVFKKKVKPQFQNLQLRQVKNKLTIEGTIKKLSPHEHYALKKLQSGLEVELNDNKMNGGIDARELGLPAKKDVSFKEAVQLLMDNDWPGAIRGDDGQVTDQAKRFRVNGLWDAYTQNAKDIFMLNLDDIVGDVEAFQRKKLEALGINLGE